MLCGYFCDAEFTSQDRRRPSHSLKGTGTNLTLGGVPIRATKTIPNTANQNVSQKPSI
jgi:hypothetical protein